MGISPGNWTIMTMEPLRAACGRPYHDNISNSKAPAWVESTWVIMMVGQIYQAISWASEAWVDVADNLEQLLVLKDPYNPFPDGQNQLAKSQTFFWIINLIEKMEPMIEDNIDQWEWFSAASKITDIKDEQLYDKETTFGIELKDERKRLDDFLVQIGAAKVKIRKTQARFQNLRARAETLRDGVCTNPHSHGIM